MKAKLIRSDLDVGPNKYGKEFVLQNSDPHPNGQKLNGEPIRRWKWGTVLEHPVMWKLVRQGVAIPEDDECRKQCGLTPEQMAAAQAHYEKLMTDGSYMRELIAKANTPKMIDEDEDV